MLSTTMKTTIILGILLISQLAFAGAAPSTEGNYKGWREPYATLEDFKDQSKEILAISDFEEFERRWVGLINRANSEPWKSRLESLDVRPTELFSECDIGLNHSGEIVCHRIMVYSCPTDTTSNNHDKQTERCETDTGLTRAEKDRCIERADRTYDRAMDACKWAAGADALGTAIGGSTCRAGGAGCGCGK